MMRIAAGVVVLLAFLQTDLSAQIHQVWVGVEGLT